MRRKHKKFRQTENIEMDYYCMFQMLCSELSRDSFHLLKRQLKKFEQIKKVIQLKNSFNY